MSYVNKRLIIYIYIYRRTIVSLLAGVFFLSNHNDATNRNNVRNRFMLVKLTNNVALKLFFNTIHACPQVWPAQN